MKKKYHLKRGVEAFLCLFALFGIIVGFMFYQSYVRIPQIEQK